jgi:hypothetical protein
MNSLKRSIAALLWALTGLQVTAQSNFDGLLHQGPYRPNIHGSADELSQDAYVYQVQSMANVNWLYIGMAPRQDDPSKIKVVFSKTAKTMRVEMKLSRADLAAYPGYLVKRASQVQRLIEDNGVEFYQPWRLQNFYAAIIEASLRYGIEPNYNNVTYEQGYELLKENFPSNVFMTRGYHEGTIPDDIAAVAHFVYPITAYKRGASWPPDKTYFIQDVYGPESLLHTVQERRSYHRKRNSEGVVYGSDHIFSGWPAFWIDSRGAGTGVHGPIRYAKVNERGNSKQRAPYGNGPDQMRRFWNENEFRRDPVKMLTGIEGLVSYRWDVVRTNNSNGCFRAETLELRHLLPADPMKIFNDIAWEVQTDVDVIDTPQGEKYVDVNYYMVNPFAFPMARADWVRREINIDSDVFMQNSHVFEYLDPATLEFKTDGGSELTLMGKFNRAGTDYEEEQARLEAERLRQQQLERMGRMRPQRRPIENAPETDADATGDDPEFVPIENELETEAGFDGLPDIEGQDGFEI